MGIDPQRRLDIIARIASMDNDVLFEQISQLVEQAGSSDTPERIGKPLPNSRELLDEIQLNHELNNGKHELPNLPENPGGGRGLLLKPGEKALFSSSHEEFLEDLRSLKENKHPWVGTPPEVEI
ncbi:MAG: hypothetical protein AAGF87_13215 [Bacteroidota bacterium]